MQNRLFHLIDRLRLPFAASIVGLVLAVSNCSEPVAAPSIASPASRISQSIVDGNHSGNKHFFFLPPMVTGLSQGSGTSDDTQRPTVVVCEWKSDNGGSCGAIITQFARTGGATARDIVYDATSQQYQVNWKTDECDAGPCTLDPAKTYRLRVLVGAYELGHADIDVVSNGSQLKNVQTGEYIGLVDGRTLPIKFRIEQGAASIATSTNPVSVGIEGGVVTNGSGTVALEFQNGSLSGTKPITIQAVTTPLLGANDFSPPVELGPDGATFDKPVTLTLAFDGRKVPPGVPFDKLAIWVWKGDSWDIVPNSVVNVTDNTVSAPISHFSIYQVGLWWWRPDPNLNAYALTVGGSVTLAASVTAYDVAPATYCNTVYGQDASGAWVYSQVCSTVSETYSYIPYGLRVSFLALDPAWHPSSPDWNVFRAYVLPDGSAVTGYLPQDPFHPVYPAPSTVARFDSPGYGIVGTAQIGSLTFAESPPLRGLAEGIVSFAVQTGSELSWRWSIRVYCPARSLSVAPAATQLSPVSPGNTVQLSATRRDASNNVVNGCSNVFWTSSDNAVATVDGTGLVTAHALGTATIIARASGIAGTISPTTITATAAITVKVPGYSLVYDAGNPANLETEVITQQSDGSAQNVIARYNLGGGGIGSMARWSHKGKKIVYQIATPQNGDLFLYDVEAQTTTQLTHNAGLNVGADFSPDDSKILFTSTRTGHYNLWLMNLTDPMFPVTQLTNGTEEDGGGASFSPDGTKIGFTRGDGSGRDLWIMSTSNPSDVHQITANGGNKRSIRWSPDGATILNTRDNTLYMIDPNTDHPLALSEMKVVDTHGFNASEYDWSSDGQKIVFVAAGAWQLYMMNPDASDFEKIPTPDGLQTNFPSFHP